MNRFIWAFAAVALAVVAVVGFILLQPTAERANNPRPTTEPSSVTDHSPQVPAKSAVERESRR
jgi:hypothetical protein